MERLTEWNGGQTRHAYYPRCFKEPCYGGRCKIKECPFETAVCERLAAYEDTGLTPERCAEFARADAEGRYIVMRDAEQEGVARLRELAEADKAGRVVVLPCKVGDTVYRVFNPQGREPVISAHTLLSVDYIVRWLNKFGKTVFLTREEAERAMEGRKDA